MHPIAPNETNYKANPYVYCEAAVQTVFYLLSVLRASRLWKGELFRTPQPLQFRVLSKMYGRHSRRRHYRKILVENHLLQYDCYNQ